MAKVMTDESNYSAIASQIRSKLGVSTRYKPSEMAAAIGSISGVSSSDNGKVVVDGQLTQQTSRSVSQNGTYDTTTNNEVVVNVSGGGGSVNILSGSEIPESSEGVNGSLYLQYIENPSGYSLVEYIDASGGQYIDTGVQARQQLKTVVDFQFENTYGSSDSTLLGGTGSSSSVIYLGINPNSSYKGYYFNWSGSFLDIRNRSLTNRHVVETSLRSGNIEIIEDGSVIYTSTDTLSETTASNNLTIFARNGSGNQFGGKLYGLKIYDWLDNGALIRDFVPAIRNSDNVIGLYEILNDVFYVNQGSGTFTAGEYIDGSIVATYLKVNGSWVPIEGQDIADVNLGS